MPVFEVQQLLARLYTDPRLLQEYLADRAGFSVKYGIGDAGLIGQIDEGELEFFAVSLRCKRAGEVKKLLPMTTKALGCGFADEFERYAGAVIPTGERKHLADAMAFCEHMIANAAPILERQALEAISFELCDFKTGFNLEYEGKAPVIVRAMPAYRPWLRLKRFRHMLPALTGILDLAEPENKRSRMVLFARFPGLRGIWYW